MLNNPEGCRQDCLEENEKCQRAIPQPAMVNPGHRPSIWTSPSENPTILSIQPPRYSRTVTGDKYAERPTTVRYETMPRVPRNSGLQPG